MQTASASSKRKITDAASIIIANEREDLMNRDNFALQDQDQCVGEGVSRRDEMQKNISR
jgi:hypothetical protein